MNVSVTAYVIVAVFSMVMSMVRFSPGRVRNDVGKLVTVKGSSIWMSRVFVVHMYVAAATVPSKVPIRMKSIMDTSYPRILIVMLCIMYQLYAIVMSKLKSVIPCTFSEMCNVNVIGITWLTSRVCPV